MLPGYEVRNLSGAEVRVVRDAEGRPTIRGTAIIFDSLSVDLGGFRERIAPDATIEFEDGLVSLFNHDSNMILGRSPDTLRHERTDAGIVYEVTPSEQRADVVAAVERGDVRGNSFMFRVPSGGDVWERQPDGSQIRTVRALQVMEMGPVVFPAYRETDVAVARRSLEQWLDSERRATPGEMRRRELETMN